MNDSVGLKVGLEFHQRLDTHKLFCNCESLAFAENFNGTVVRKLRPVAGELGEIDPAALQEFLKGNTFVYQTFSRSTDLVELDEEPPHALNQKALDIALEIALMLDCRVADEVHVMRKTVIDGSSVSGFQRTALVGTGGSVNAGPASVPILGVYLEEESAGIVSAKAGEGVPYSLDRLCIPLVEIATGILELTPEQVKEAALKIGTMLRLTGRVQRGIGTIRQDVNISINRGARTEIKGLQDIRSLDKVIKLEVQRQQRLIELKEKLVAWKTPRPEHKVHDFSKYFANIEWKFGKNVYGIVLRGFAGLIGFELQPNKRFGTELSEHARGFGIGGIIHTDEDLDKYGIAVEIDRIKKDLKLSEKDALVLIASQKEKAEKALDAIHARVLLAFGGVPRETRKLNEDLTTSFMRPMPGEHRLYPETDVPPVRVAPERLEKIRKQLPEPPEKVLKRLVKMGLSAELAEQMLTSHYLQLFERLVAEKADATLVAATLENTLTSLAREGVDVSVFEERHFSQLFKSRVPKQAIPDLLRDWSKNPAGKMPAVSIVTGEEVRKDAKRLIREHADLQKENAFGALMGELMKKYRGRIDGGRIAKILKEELK